MIYQKWERDRMIRKRLKKHKKGKLGAIAPLLFIGCTATVFSVNNQVARASEQLATNQTVIENSNEDSTISDDEKTKTSTAGESSGITEGSPVADAVVIESSNGDHILTNESKDAPSSMDEISGQPATNQTVIENTNEDSAISDDESTEKKEWVSFSEIPGTVVVNEVEGIRYNTLSSTFENDNGEKMALFEKEGLQVDDTGNATVNLSFVELSEPGEGRFGVLLKYGQPNYIMVGYDREGWFWQYKSAVDSAWMTTKRSVSAPTKGSKNELMISLKKDGQLNASVNGENLFDTYNIPKNVMDTLKENKIINVIGEQRTLNALLIIIKNKGFSRSPWLPKLQPFRHKKATTATQQRCQ